MFIKKDDVKPLVFDGLQIFDYTDGLDGKSTLAGIVIPVDAKHKTSWSERSDKYYYMIQGKMRFTVDDKVQELGPGDVCIIAQGSRFRYENAGEAEARMIVMHTPGFQMESERFEES